MIEAAAEAERQSQHMGRAITERMEEMVEARAAEMTLEEASEIESVEDEETPTSTEEAPSTEESEEDDWNWSEQVLVGVMQKNGITDRDAFVEFAKCTWLKLSRRSPRCSGTALRRELSCWTATASTHTSASR